MVFGLGIAAGYLIAEHRPAFLSSSHAEEGKTAPSPLTLEALQKEIEELQGQTDEQSGGMLAVGFHYANLYHAVEKGNWPLADFYLEETEEHIEHAIRLEPFRKNSQGETLDLKGIFDGVKESLWPPLEKAIKEKNSKKFKAAYKGMMEGCYTCHKSVEKPYLRPGIPAPGSSVIINADPNAKWPN
ncbi:hypothetical protein HYR69_07780 [Candidatus Sumerlaeota bacterium]|nr:hypothetical protein [Candidatus Sumerlaeota bacterium]